MKYFALILFIAFLVACSEQKNPDKRLKDKNVPVEFDLGIAKDGVYKNDFFEMSFEYNENWYLQDDKEREALLDEGIERATGENAEKGRKLEAGKVNNVNLFVALEQAPGEVYDFNSSIIVLAENLALANGKIKSGKEYLETAFENFANESSIASRSSIQPKTIGSKQFHRVTLNTDTGIIEVEQQCYAIIINDFALMFIFSYANEEQEAEMYKFLSSVKFN